MSVADFFNRHQRAMTALSGLLLVIVSADAVYLGWRAHRLGRALTRATAQDGALSQQQEQLTARWENLKRQFDQLTQSHQALLNERTSLMAQVAQAQAGVEGLKRASEERDVLEQLLQQATGEQRTLRTQLDELQRQVAALQETNAQATQQHERLKQQLAKKKRPQEPDLKKELAAGQRERGELQKVLRSTQQALNESHKLSAKFQGQLRKLQQDYAKVVGEHNALKRETRTVPQDVSQLAREHERLVKETADMHYNLGVLFSNNKRYDQAAAEFRKTVELRPDDPDAYYNLGVIYAEHLPDRNKAIAHFRRYLQLNPRARDASWVKQYIASWQAWEVKERLE